MHVLYDYTWQYEIWNLRKMSSTSSWVNGHSGFRVMSEIFDLGAAFKPLKPFATAQPHARAIYSVHRQSINRLISQSAGMCNWHLSFCDVIPGPGWPRGSVVRASVWRTFPDMSLIYGWRVTTSWVRRPLWVNQPGQLSLPSLLGR